MNDLRDPLDRRLRQLTHELHDAAPAPVEWDAVTAPCVPVTARATNTTHRARWLGAVAAAAAALALIGALAVRDVDDDRPDATVAADPESAPPSSIPFYAGEDLDTTLPPVGRGWIAVMEFSPDPDTDARFYDAWQAALTTCMHGRGYPAHQAVPFPPNSNFVDRVSPLDRRYAAVMGYHALPADPVDPNTYQDDAAYAAAAECANAASESTFGGARTYFDLNDQLSAGLSRAIAGFVGSDVGRSASREWSACMTERGYSYATRDEAILDFAERSTVTEQEIATRLDDLDCDVAVGYTQRQHDWEQARIDQWRSTQQDLIDRTVREKQRMEGYLSDVEAGS